MEIVDSILAVLSAWGKMAPRPFETKGAWGKRLRDIDKPQFERAVRHLQKRGLVKVINQNGRRFIELTRKGQLESLLVKAKVKQPDKWDEKWRLIIFDIPESSKEKRHLFRSLLKANGFYKLQASVYISPSALNRAAVAYLKQTGLINYVRILRVDEVDDDKELKRHFNLQ